MSILISMMIRMKHYRGRLIDHVQIIVRDLEKRKRFYKAAMEVFSIPFQGEDAHHFTFDEMYFTANDTPTGPTHLAFQASSRQQVDDFYRVCLAAGGKDDGPPGERDYHPGYYAAFAVDPDGNYLETVFHGPFEKSTDAVVITPK